MIFFMGYSCEWGRKEARPFTTPMKRVELVEHAGDGERAQLAEGMAREGDRRPDAAGHARPARERCAEDRGLREPRRLVDAFEGVVADQGEDRVEQVRARGGHSLAHPRNLASLARKQDSGGCCVEHASSVHRPRTAHNPSPPPVGTGTPRVGGHSKRP
ncbi:MAG: hypothetical protein KY463_09775 [Actinobacteria bacterium]|nr:hypothetical protein [Actinomycetota bacterium]